MIALISPEYVKYLQFLELYLRPVENSAMILVSSDAYNVEEKAADFNNFTRNIYHLEISEDKPVSDGVILSVLLPLAS